MVPLLFSQFKLHCLSIYYINSCSKYKLSNPKSSPHRMSGPFYRDMVACTPDEG